MLQLVNRTPFAALLAVFPDPAGIDSVYAAVKASFDLSSGLPVLAAKPARLLAADVFWGDPAATSLRAAADVTLAKPACDVMLLGRAIADTPVAQMDVQLRVGALERRLRVFGNRHWERRESSWVISEPEPFERMPLRWEHAYGGIAGPASDGVAQYEARNPVGQGYFGEYEDDFAQRRLPNLEDPDHLIVTPRDRPPPACFAPVAPTWEPRRSRAGTYDAAWQGERAPFLPRDFDARYFNAAAPQLVFAGYPAGGESVEIVGCTAGQPLRFDLPQVSLQMQWDFDGRTVDGVANLDSVLIEPDFARLQMVWRAVLPVGKKVLRMRQLAIECREYADLPEAA